MTREELERLFAGELEDEHPMADFSALARGAGRAREARELAEAAAAGGQYDTVDEVEVQTVTVSERILAAAPPEARRFPVRYTVAGWAVGLGLSITGRTVAVLEAGGDALWLSVSGREIRLSQGETVELDDLEAPPAMLRARLDDGRRLLLTPRPASP
ncbi:MAG: hypothetical protein H6739_20695 [Alphaproteobacteria bacterium]|nr:hypothetical protein [Alphaproteobacteria bacterium]